MGPESSRRELFEEPGERRAEKKEAKELGPAEFVAGFDKERLGAVVADYATQGEPLNAVIDILKRLPEKLDFKPGITLIVGENGQGKTALARSLYYAAKIHEAVGEGRRESDAVLEFTNPRYSSRPQELLSAGFSTKLATTMHVEGLNLRTNPSDTYQRTIEYHDYSKYLPGTADFEASRRQTIDLYHQAITKRQKDLKGSRFVEFHDEPESGLSPKRQKLVAEQLSKVVPEGSIGIVVTNSVVLYDSDLPRIDMDFPERGIFRPSEYPPEKT